MKNAKDKSGLVVIMLWFSPAASPQVKQELRILRGFSSSLLTLQKLREAGLQAALPSCSFLPTFPYFWVPVGGKALRAAETPDKGDRAGDILIRLFFCGSWSCLSH